MIIDEEQRFGVEHKEALKKLRLNVDVLAMSATPIPRTLEMAITGIREMSVIATPPEERHPVLTFAGPVRRGPGAGGDPPRAGPRGPGVLHPQPGADSIEKTAQADRRTRARGAGRGGARPDERAHARAGDGRLLGAPVRRAGLHHDRRGRPRHLHRQHAADRARRPARPVPAAPAARTGRSRPRARLRLLPLSAGEAAHRDRPRPAGDDGRAHRPRRRAWRSR